VNGQILVKRRWRDHVEDARQPDERAAIQQSIAQAVTLACAPDALRGMFSTLLASSS
jgi:hypothetical protein